MDPHPGDLVRYDFYEDDPGEVGLVLEVLDTRDFWSPGLGRYPDHVLRVLTASGEVRDWDFFSEPGTDPELEIVIEAR